MREAGNTLRVRQVGDVGRLTFKGPGQPGRHKSREELEIELTAPATMWRILERLGFAPVFRYEKFRTEYRRESGDGTVMLDETPIGVYLELEGMPDWIDATAAELGFSQTDYVQLSYYGLYLDWCARTGINPGSMTFPPGDGANLSEGVR